MAITLDGIAKGYIVDQGVAVLSGLGFENVVVEAGGDLMASGLKDGTVPWRIGLRSPRKEQPGFMVKVDVLNKAVATSGDYQQYYTPDLNHHHIIDPRSGYSVPQLASATIVAPTCMQADALATSLMVLDIQEGLSLIESLDKIEAYLVSKELKVFPTQGFQI